MMPTDDRRPTDVVPPMRPSTAVAVSHACLPATGMFLLMGWRRLWCAAEAMWSISRVIFRYFAQSGAFATWF